MSRKLVLDDGRAERELVVRDKLTVGRDPSCDVSDADPRLSRRHAEFQLTPKGIVVRDLDSRNGVRVNGRTVRETLLSPGDLVEVAHLSIRFLDDGKSDAVTQSMSGIQPRPVEGVQVKDGFEDDRTRVLPVSAISTTPSGPVPEPKTPPPNAADATIRVAQPVSAPRPPLRLGVKDLFATSWGVRVLGQGALLAVRRVPDHGRADAQLVFGRARPRCLNRFAGPDAGVSAAGLAGGRPDGGLAHRAHDGAGAGPR